MAKDYTRREDVRQPVRLGTRISAETNDWLDIRSQEVGLTKSAIINMAVEQYRKETESVRHMPKVNQFIEDFMNKK